MVRLLLMLILLFLATADIDIQHHTISWKLILNQSELTLFP